MAEVQRSRALALLGQEDNTGCQMVARMLLRCREAECGSDSEGRCDADECE